MQIVVNANRNRFVSLLVFMLIRMAIYYVVKEKI
jgi:hypothetical protein